MLLIGPYTAIALHEQGDNTKNKIKFRMPDFLRFLYIDVILL